MRMGEFVKSVYPIREKVQSILEGPVMRVMNENDLSCDAVLFVDGEYQKVVYITDDEYIPVLELVMLTREEVLKTNNPDLLRLYDVYMEDITVEQMNLAAMASTPKEYVEAQKRKEALLDKCTR